MTIDVGAGGDSAIATGLPEYQAFLEAKIVAAPTLGLPCTVNELPTHRLDGQVLRDHQRAITAWGVQGGRRAYFLNFGLGKSTVQALTARTVLDRLGDDAMGLIVAPLGARGDFIADAAQIGETVRFVRSDADVAAAFAAGIRLVMTNFDTVRDGKLTVARFSFASIDEAAALRDYGSETFQTFLPLFATVPYRYVATAMPAPNRYKELIHYAAFLGIMDSGQALTRFFQRNSEQAGDLTLYPHKEDEFWLWVNSWAVFLQKPSDLGFSDEGYDLPALEMRYHKVAAKLSEAGIEPNGQGRLLRDAAMGVVEASREARDTIDARVRRVAELVQQSAGDHFILWHDLEDERRAIERALPSAKSVFGAQAIDRNEEIADAFAKGHFRLLAAKPSMLGAGRNFQYHCHRAIIFPTYKFHDFLQSLHRIWRFMQAEQVVIDLVYAETQSEQLRVLLAKWDQHKAMVERMSAIIRRYGLNHDAAAGQLRRSIGVERVEVRGEGWTAVNNDCVAECARMETDSVDLIVTSIPFGNHYEYSARYEDFGHTDDNAHFFAQLDYLTPQLLRILKPGRIAAIHVKDRIRFASVTGMTRPTVDPFHANTIAHFRKHGFGYMGFQFISTDVVRENNQTYRLTYKELCKDSTTKGCGSPEFLLWFFKLPTDRSNGYADEPVTKDPADYSLARWQIDAEALWRSSGDRLLTAEELSLLPAKAMPTTFRAWSVMDVYDHEQHVGLGEALAARDALPKTYASIAAGSCRDDVWTDVVRMQTLNGEQTRRGLENHICPLQFDIVDRAIRKYSNPSDLVFDPFGGLMTVPVRALKLGRRGAAVELNSRYFADGLRYLRETEAHRATPSMFDLLDVAA